MAKTTFSVHVLNRNESFACKAEQSLLTGMLQQNKTAIRVGCRGGGCGVCKVRVVSGDYRAKKMSAKHISAEQRERGLVLSCQVFPRSNMAIESDYAEAEHN